MVSDMTKGGILSALLKFSLPTLLSVACQQLYNIADTMIAGNFVSPLAISAIGASYPITMIFLAVATGGSVGASVVVARLFGSKDYTFMKTAVNTTITAFLAVSALLTAVGIILSQPMLTLLGTPGNIFTDSDIYLKIYILGLPFLFLYNACNGIFTALGDSRTPLIFLIGSSVANIILDLLFVTTFAMGIDGVAWATFIAQGAASVLSLVTLRKRLKKIESGKPQLMSIDALKQISRISIPSILQSSFVSVGNLFIQGIINGYGSSVMGGYASAVKLNTFALTCFTTMSNSVSSFVAQNMGAGQHDRVKKGIKYGLIICFLISLPFALLFVIFGGELVNLFSSEADAQIIETGRTFLLTVAPFYLLICLKIGIDGGLRGCGIMKPFMISTWLDLVLRVAFAFILSPVFGSNGIWFSWPVGWVLSVTLDIFFYRWYFLKGNAFNRI